MPKDIIITAGKVTVEAELYDTPTVQSIVDKMTITAQAQRWGGEIYFSIPVTAELENDSRDVLEAGELGYVADDDDQFVLSHGLRFLLVDSML